MSEMFDVKIIADSVSPVGVRITTMQLRYPRFIHSELMTHRVFSRNASSSRAIPVEKMLEQVINEPAMPIHWGKNQPGMQAKAELEDGDLLRAQELWKGAALNAAAVAELMADLGLHKQVANRILEPFQFMHTVVTSTEWDNFFELRCHPDAQPEFQALATMMRDARQASRPLSLPNGAWHLPYVKTWHDITGVYYGESGELSLRDALKVSASCCAQVSYRQLDDSLDKALAIYRRLVESKPIHASPVEHQARALALGESHALCGNFTGWVQHRKLIELEQHRQEVRAL